MNGGSESNPADINSGVDPNSVEGLDRILSSRHIKKKQYRQEQDLL